MRKPGEVIEVLKRAIADAGEECIFTLYDGRRGTVVIDGKTTSSNRAVWTLVHGDPGDLFVLHSCHEGQRGCININHLYLGDHLQNMADRKAIGRYGSGADNPAARLTEDDVRDIRRRRRNGEYLKSIAAVYDVHLSTIHLIATGKKWGWLTD